MLLLLNLHLVDPAVLDDRVQKDSSIARNDRLNIVHMASRKKGLLPPRYNVVCGLPFYKPVGDTSALLGNVPMDIAGVDSMCDEASRPRRGL